jgi:hypothetical protein|tara:strand:+ start:1660 stop:1854 length:195 start_codon:yes stop_codon:yes gene_type:complete
MLKKLIDTFFSAQTRISWRRITALALGCGLLCAQLISGEQWLYLAMTYIAGDSAEKALAALSKN